MKTEFSQDQFDRAYPDGIEHHWWSLARGRILTDVLRRWAGEDATVLEVGCGRGIVVQALCEAGIDCRGVELAPVRPLAAVARRVRAGTDAAELPLSERLGYDTLLLLDVIEHIAEPAGFIAGLAGSFPGLSRLIVTVPAREELWSNYDEFYGHHTRYTRQMLDELAAGLGWRLAGAGYFFHSVYLPGWLLARLGRDRATRLHPPTGPARRAHALIAAAMRLEYHLLPASLPGTSLFAVLTLP